MTDFEQLLSLRTPELQSILSPLISMKGLKIDVLRLDKIHPVISGNKWFKLKYFLREASDQKFDTILTFGGPWSNHIIATACICKKLGFSSTAIIRGEKPKVLSQTLLQALEFEMTLEFVSRRLYSQKNEAVFKDFLGDRFGHAYVIPEGGAGSQGIMGSREILNLVEINKYSHVICCIGTGTMFTGIAEASLPEQVIIGISVLKGIDFVPEQLINTPGKKNFCTIFYDYHFEGYAKKTPGLLKFMNQFFVETGIETDFVYTGKLMYGVYDLILKDYFPANSQILVIHSGGLQGNASLPKGALLF